MYFCEYVKITKKSGTQVAKELEEPQSCVSIWLRRLRNIPPRASLKIEAWSGGAVTVKECLTNKAA